MTKASIASGTVFRNTNHTYLHPSTPWTPGDGCAPENTLELDGMYCTVHTSSLHKVKYSTVWNSTVPNKEHTKNSGRLWWFLFQCCTLHDTTGQGRTRQTDRQTDRY